MSSELMVSEILKGISNGFMQGQQIGMKQRENARLEKESQLKQELTKLQLDRERSQIGQEEAIAPGTSPYETARIMARRRHGKGYGELSSEEQMKLEDIELARMKETGEIGPKTKEPSLRDTTAAEKFEYQKSEDLRKRRVKIFGQTMYTEFDASEAKKIRTKMADSQNALHSVNQLYKLAMNPAETKADPRKRREAKVISQALQGQLRLAIIGPGAMSDQEREVLKIVVSSPEGVFNIPAADRAGLRTLANKIKVAAILEAQSRGVEFKDSDFKRLGMKREDVEKWGSLDEFNNQYEVGEEEKGFWSSIKSFFGGGDKPKPAEEFAKEKGYGRKAEATTQKRKTQLLSGLDAMMAAAQTRGERVTKEDLINKLLKKGTISQDDALMLKNEELLADRR